jgi:hypothetical protein
MGLNRGLSVRGRLLFGGWGVVSSKLVHSLDQRGFWCAAFVRASELVWTINLVNVARFCLSDIAAGAPSINKANSAALQGRLDVYELLEFC